MIRKAIARRLRRWAQWLSPLHTDRQIRELRGYYDNHDSIIGSPIRHQRFGLNLDEAAYDRLGVQLARIDEAERAAWHNLNR